ncbi:hypothetical protein M9458_054293, partial [Cirrhinus mrigala]
PACSNHSAPLSLSSQDQDLLTLTPKRRARRKTALQYAASIDDSDTFLVTPEPTEIAPVSPEPIKSTSVKSHPIKYAPVPSGSIKLTSVFLVLAMSNPMSEPDKSSVIPQSSKSVPAKLKSAGSVSVTAGSTEFTVIPPELTADTTVGDNLTTSTCRNQRERKAHAEQALVPSLVVQEDPDLSAPNPEILNDLTLVPSPLTFSKQLTSHVMPSETSRLLASCYWKKTRCEE